MGGLDCLRSIAAEVVVTLVVSEDDDDVEGGLRQAEGGASEEKEGELHSETKYGNWIGFDEGGGGMPFSIRRLGGFQGEGMSFLHLKKPSFTGNERHDFGGNPARDVGGGF